METGNTMELLDSVDCVGKHKPAIARFLAERAIGSGNIVVLVKTRGRLRDVFKRHALQVARSDSVVIYIARTEADVQPFADLMLSFSLWHQPYFHLLIGGPELEKEIGHAIASGDFKADRVETECLQGVKCYVQPLDDILEFHAATDAVSCIEAVIVELRSVCLR